jgi:hypothetical protein
MEVREAPMCRMETGEATMGEEEGTVDNNGHVLR